MIEKTLFQKEYFTVMRSFMLYRHTRKLQREHVAGLNDDTTYVDSTQTIEEYIEQTDWRINANANTTMSKRCVSDSPINFVSMLLLQFGALTLTI